MISAARVAAAIILETARDASITAGGSRLSHRMQAPASMRTAVIGCLYCASEAASSPTMLMRFVCAKYIEPAKNRRLRRRIRLGAGLDDVAHSRGFDLLGLQPSRSTSAGIATGPRCGVGTSCR